jgi:hypothetical protein
LGCRNDILNDLNKYKEGITKDCILYKDSAFKRIDEKIYNTPIPDQFQFMDTIGFLNKDNFFERRSTEYQKAYNERNRANDWQFNIQKEY